MYACMYVHIYVYVVTTLKITKKSKYYIGRVATLHELIIIIIIIIIIITILLSQAYSSR